MFNKLFSFLYINVFKIFPVRINLFLSKLFKKFNDMHLKASYSKDFNASLDIEGSKFNLILMKNDNQAQGVYQKLHFNKESYETIMVKTLVESIDLLKAKSFLDIGAFMGYYACFVASRLKDRINIHAIESNPKYVEYIKKSIKINNFKKVNVHNGILSNKEEFLFVKNETVTSKVDEEKNFTKLKSITLDELCEQQKIIPEIMKIDVHGAEGKVLFGSNKMLTNFTKIILLELHTSAYLKKFSDGLSKKEIILFLNNLGFKCYLVSSFRDHDFKKNNENYEYKEINKENFELIFFDRDKADQFIFCIKNNLDIENFKLFNKSF